METTDILCLAVGGGDVVVPMCYWTNPTARYSRLEAVPFVKAR